MKLIVLLSTYNGANYIRQQLDSLLAQSLPGVEILVRDDGSTDATCEILEEYAKQGALRWYAGSNLGPACSFWQLLYDCGDADYYAFCDQDDVWDADKLEAAVSALLRFGAEMPALYCSDVRVTDGVLNVLYDHMIDPCPADYPHALLRNLAPGCTFVFNHHARKLLCLYDAKKLGVNLHDWTAYQVVTCFGQVVFDTVPHMRYRQHGNNVNGAHRKAAISLVQKVPAFWNGAMRNSRRRQALQLEHTYGDIMPAENRELTGLIAHYNEDAAKWRKLLYMLWNTIDGTDARMAWLLALFNRL